MIHASFQQLRLFEAVARNGSFTRAAEEVHLTQPAVSIQIKRLEEQLGSALFEQIGKRIYRTAAGDALLEACRDVFGRLAAFEDVIDELRGEVAGPLRIAVATTAKYFLPDFLGAFMRLHPKVEPHLKVTNRAGVLARMEDNVDDLYILANLPENTDGVEVHAFLDDQLVMFASVEHPLAREKNIPFERLAEEPLLMREPGSGIRMSLENIMKDKGVMIPAYLELGSGEAIKQGVMAGIGIGMLSTHSLNLELDTGRIAILDVKDLELRRRWHAVHLRGKRLGLAAQKFIDFLQTSDVLSLKQRKWKSSRS